MALRYIYLHRTTRAIRGMHVSFDWTKEKRDLSYTAIQYVT